jgi:hypothetical protein
MLFEPALGVGDVVSVDVFERFDGVALGMASHDEFGNRDSETDGILGERCA